jgi:hypothetical protein
MSDLEVLVRQLYWALLLTKSDAERNGFTYGPQSACQKAIAAFAKWTKTP